MLWASGLFPRRMTFPVLAAAFGVFGVFFLLKSAQLNGPTCLGAPVCAFSVVLLVFGVMFAIVAVVLALLWALSQGLRRLLPPG